MIVRRFRSLVTALGVTAIALCARGAGAQGNTAETLANARRLYADLQVERAVVLLRQVVSPSSPYEVSREQRVQAYTYLGAALAVLGQRDSAIVYLRAALERDPFVDLDPQTFSPVERAALVEARARTFAVGVRPVAATTIDPRTERATFTILTTHAARTRLEIVPATGGDGLVLFDDESEGLRELAWAGVLADGRLAPPGRYALVVRGRSSRGGRVDSARVWFEVRHDRPALEDSLPPLGPDALLPEIHTRTVARNDLLRGLGVAAAALLTHQLLSDRQLRGGGGYAAGVAVAGAAVGTAAFVVRQRNPHIPANAAENRRRIALRDRANAEIAARNAERLALTKLALAPAAGAGQ